MAHIIIAPNPYQAWKSATNYILRNSDSHLTVIINSPTTINQLELDAFDASGLSDERCNDVSNTIFPVKYWGKHIGSRQQFYSNYINLYNRARGFARNRSKWGNYFLRQIAFGRNQTNQLENIVAKLARTNGNLNASCFIHISSVDTDTNTRLRGGPCLQYLQFSLQDGNVNLTAVYRNHDFLNKALGNYIGLSNLLDFVANQAGKRVGVLTCISLNYFVSKKRDLAAFVI